MMLPSINTQETKRLPGQYYDEEINLNYNKHRYYDPSIGRYITSDPIGLAGGSNTYLYANANPIIFIDPLGLVSCTCSVTRPITTKTCNLKCKCECENKSTKVNVTASFTLEFVLDECLLQPLRDATRPTPYFEINPNSFSFDTDSDFGDALIPEDTAEALEEKTKKKCECDK